MKKLIPGDKHQVASVISNFKTDGFAKFSKAVGAATGQPLTFSLACLIVLVWAITGPIFNFSNTWQLVINTGTTIVTFLMVFLIQNIQNRDTAAIQLKLNEIIRCLEGASNHIIDAEEKTLDELDEMKKVYIEVAKLAQEELERELITDAAQVRSKREKRTPVLKERTPVLKKRAS